MSKLSLLILNTGQGVNTIYQNINTDNDAWRSRADDVRPIVEEFANNNKDSENKLISFASFVEEGYVFSTIHIPAHAERTGDNIAFFLFVPYDTDISAKEIYDVISKLSQQIVMGVNPAEVDNIISANYPHRPLPMLLPQSSIQQDDAAVMLSPSFNLFDMMGDNIFYPAFFQYRRIFFVLNTVWPVLPAAIKPLNTVGGRINSGLCTLTTSPKTKAYDITVDYKPIGNGLIIPKGMAVTLSYLRDGFTPVTAQVVVKNSGEVPLPPSGSMLFSLPMNAIVVKNTSHQVVSKAEVTVNGLKPTDGAWQVNPNGEITVVVRAEGYEEITKRCRKEEFTSGRPIQIFLQKITYSYTFELPLDNGDTIEFSVDGDKELEKSPLPGYECVKPSLKRPNRLKYAGKGKNGLMMLALGIATGAILVGLAWILCSLNNNPAPVAAPEQKKEQPADSGTTTPPAGENGDPINPVTPAVDASDYFDTNDVWTKADLDSIAPGLFDAINLAKLEEVVKFAGQFPNSKRLDSIAQWSIAGSENYKAEKPIKEHITTGDKLEFSKIKSLYTSDWDKSTTKPTTKPTGKEKPTTGKKTGAGKLGQP